MGSYLRLTSGVLLAAILFVIGCADEGTDIPGASASITHGVFSDLDFDAAKDAATGAGKLFIVDATATWCGPCKMMERDTWANESVKEWFAEHAVAIQVDVDQQSDLARALRIEVMPTVIVIRDGEEFDRATGYQDWEGLIAWLEGVKRGERAIDKLRELAGDRMDEDGTIDVEARYRLASTLAMRGELDEATEEFVWLWDNMLEFSPAMYGVRLSFMAGNMTDLAERHSPAREAFTGLRDRLQPAVDDGSADREVMIDWLHLNRIIADDRATLSWFDRTKGDPRVSQAIEPVVDEVFELLTSRNRWSDAGEIYPAPVAKMRQIIEFQEEMAKYESEREVPEEQRKRVRDYREESLRASGSQLYAACLAAERDRSAAEIAEVLLQKQDSELARIALIEAALMVGQPRQDQLKWLDEAEASGDKHNSLRRRLELALQEYNPAADADPD